MSVRKVSIDLNADLGEGFAWDLPLLDLVTSASVCCGAHAGDRDTILQTLAAGSTRGVNLGAHPGYPDREAFGRRDQNLEERSVHSLIVDQTEWLRDLAAEVGATLGYLKPHGALYNQAQRDESIARGVVSAALALRFPLLGQPGSLLESLANASGVMYIAEGFPERRYTLAGALVPRTDPGSVLVLEAEIDKQIEMLMISDVKTLCVHGDVNHAVSVAKRVRRSADRLGIELRSFVVK